MNSLAQRWTLQLLIGLASSIAASSGGWIGTGGEWILDSNNPWFLKNTATVKYCVEISKTQMSITEKDIVGLIEAGIQFWKNDFAQVDPSFGITKQTYQYVGSCTNKVDLEFRMGSESLTKEQKEFFEKSGENLGRYIGVSVRTEYDRVNLKGRGFVYISGDQSHGINGRVPQGIWSFQGLLYRLLVHELGHVFGLAHSSDGIMSANYPERMIRSFQGGNNRLGEVNSPGTVFENPSDFDILPLKDSELYSFLLGKNILTDTDTILPFDFTKDRIEWHFKNGEGKPVQVSLTKSFSFKSTHLKIPLRLYLTSEQKVFPHYRGEVWVDGPAIQPVNYTYNYEILGKTNNKKVLLFQVSGSQIEVHGYEEPLNIIRRLK